MRRWRGTVLVALGLCGALTLGGQVAPRAAQAGVGVPVAGADPMVHLEEILARSRPPEYRRLGSPGMVAASSYAAEVLEAAGYHVLRHEAPASVYRVDYGPGAEPSLVRTADGRSFPVESAFRLGAVTPPEGLTCVVRAVEAVGPGDCGFVPFLRTSPEWKSFFFEDVAGQVDAVIARGGVGVVLQGDVGRNARIAISVRRPIPSIVAVATEEELLGREVRLRVRGGDEPTTLHNVVALRPPADPSAGYTVVQAHLDGWFEAAVDNGGGAALVLAIAERLAAVPTERGLAFVLYDGEEWGLLGSRALTTDLAGADGVSIGPCGAALHLSDIVSVVNLDAPSGLASDAFGFLQRLVPSPFSLISWRALVFSEEPTLTTEFVTAVLTAGVLGAPLPVSIVNPLLGGGMDRTDGKWFHDAGIPVVWPVANTPEYHTSADVLDRVDPADLQRLLRGMVSLVRRVDDVAIGRIGGDLPPPGSHQAETSSRCRT